MPLSSVPNGSRFFRTMLSNRTTKLAIFGCVLLLCTSAVTLHAQNAGQPIIYAGGAPPTNTTVTGAYIDAFVATGGSAGGSDICSRINTAWSTAMGPLGNGINSATVDARGFAGTTAATWKCSSTDNGPFVPSNGKKAAGVLLLGNALIQTAVTWVIPSSVELRGIGSGQGANTTIQASFASGTTATPVLQMGTNGSSPDFSVVIRDLNVDCAGVGGCVGILNTSAEENSTVDHVDILNAPVYALHVSANGTSSNPGATNSGPYQDLNIFYPSCTSGCAMAIPVQIDGPGTAAGSRRAIREFKDITVTGHGIGSPFLTNAGVVIAGVSTAFTNSHIEYANYGLVVGDYPTSFPTAAPYTPPCSSCATDGVVVTSVSIGTQVGTNSAVIVGSPATGAPPTFDVTLTGIVNQFAASPTLQFNAGGSTVTTLTSADNPYIGLYAIGRCLAASCIPPVISNTAP